MNRNRLKAYAPKARRDFIKAVTDRAAFYGLTKEKIASVSVQGDVAIIGGKAFPKEVAEKRKRLEKRIRREGFEHVMEAMAYTWFNRFVAIRFMELHGYLEHGYRVLSTTNNANGTNKGGTVSGLPEIVVHAEHVDLPGLDQEKVVELKLAGNRDEELYRMLLIAQCNALHKAMPFLFERIGDATELLLPENLLHSDSLIRRMVNEIPEEEWEEVEIIGWLYQFYISEKKDQVIGKVVKSEDIPAATQLFTPNWIVKYMVQNTLGRQWVATYPNSPLRKQMEYYIEPAEQTPEVQAQLKAITPESLNPEKLTLLDPACGSGHILVEAYDLFKAIYQERGYRVKDIPRLILEKNLYGLEIDDRAAQLSAFVLIMKARADDRRIFDRGIQLNVMAIQNSPDLSDEALEALTKDYTYNTDQDKNRTSISIRDVRDLLLLFEHGNTFGSLIRVPENLYEKLPGIKARVGHVLANGDMFGKAAVGALQTLLDQADYLTKKYDFVVTNPPFMGNNAMNTSLKSLARMYYKGCSSDTFAMFIKRCINLTVNSSHIGLVTPFVWLYISSYEKLRLETLKNAVLSSLIQLEYNAFEPACVPVCTFTLQKISQKAFKGIFIDLSSFKGFEKQPSKALEAITDPVCSWRHYGSKEDFGCIPRTPIAFSLSDNFRAVFSSNRRLSDEAVIFEGLKTRNNERFIRCWFEISDFGYRWKKYSKGGGFRKWSGNDIFVVDWKDNGHDLKEFKRASGQNFKYFGLPTITYCTLSSSAFSARYINGSFFGGGGGGITQLRTQETLRVALGLLNSSVSQAILTVLSPTLNFEVGTLGAIPLQNLSRKASVRVNEIVQKCISIAKQDWDSRETSWDFGELLILALPFPNMIDAFEKVQQIYKQRFERMKRLETENNEIFVNAYGLNKDLDVAVRDDTITLERVDLREVIQGLFSYTIGCMMGRYSLDQPGHIYAHSGNDKFWEIYHEKHNKPAPTQNKNHSYNSYNSWSTFPPDADGIIPITDTDWFPDAAANRFIQFISVAWPKEQLEENLKFIADSLSPNRGESPRETIHRYISTGFFKHHMKMYKKRPIYWLFSSGKLRAFQCLVYLHRYNEGTLSRMRTEYVIPLQGKISARIEQLSGDVNAATSTAHRKKLEREKDKLVKQQTELQTFDEKLRHYADQRISLDLDDGVKVNYGKFGDLLAEVKAITGKKKK